MPEVKSSKWLSYDPIRKSPRKSIFCHKNLNIKGNKNNRLSMFGKRKIIHPSTNDRNNSPNLDSYRS
jgi:hypothetical protein